MIVTTRNTLEAVFAFIEDADTPVETEFLQHGGVDYISIIIPCKVGQERQTMDQYIAQWRYGTGVQHA